MSLKDELHTCLSLQQFTANAATYCKQMIKDFSHEPLNICEQPGQTDLVLMRAFRIEDEKPLVEMESIDKAEQTLLKIRNHITIFSGLRDDELLFITANVSFVNYKAGEFVFMQGDLGREFYYVLRGSVDISIYDPKIDSSFCRVAVLGPESTFGEVSPVIGSPRNASSKAVIDSVLLKMELRSEARDTNPKLFNRLYENIIRLLSEKLQTSNSRLV